ncbi:MAG: nicotinamide-nucleotide amidohydrolase family protein [Pseudomonadota bacterium]
MMFDAALLKDAADTLDAARRESAFIVTVESCTGGLVAAALTAVAGSSDAVEGGYVTYTNEAKVRLGVSSELVEAHGAVSEEVARAMAEAGLSATAKAPQPDGPAVSRVCVSITGIAGPGGGTAQKPVGLVHFAASYKGRTRHIKHTFGDVGRAKVREDSVVVALGLIRRALAG